MSQSEPGLDLHEWETRWAELEEELGADPAGVLPEACDLIEEMLGITGVDGDLGLNFRAAREIADAIERGDDVAPGDIGGAIENLRAIRGAVGPANDA